MLPIGVALRTGCASMNDEDDVAEAAAADQTTASNKTKLSANFSRETSLESLSGKPLVDGNALNDEAAQLPPTATAPGTHRAPPPPPAGAITTLYQSPRVQGSWGAMGYGGLGETYGVRPSARHSPRFRQPSPRSRGAAAHHPSSVGVVERLGSEREHATSGDKPVLEALRMVRREMDHQVPSMARTDGKLLSRCAVVALRVPLLNAGGLSVPPQARLHLEELELLRQGLSQTTCTRQRGSNRRGLAHFGHTPRGRGSALRGSG